MTHKMKFENVPSYCTCRPSSLNIQFSEVYLQIDEVVFNYKRHKACFTNSGIVVNIEYLYHHKTNNIEKSSMPSSKSLTT
jgi:hypothetical protein